MAGPARGLQAIAATLIVAAATAGHCTPSHAAGAAYQVDTAEVSAVGSCKVESWVSSASNRDFIAAISPACVVNLFRPVEVSAQFSRSRADDEWATAAQPKLKTNHHSDRDRIVGRGDVGDGGLRLHRARDHGAVRHRAGDAAAIEVVRINVNAGWQLDRTVSQHYFTYGAWLRLAHAGQRLDADRRSVRPARNRRGREHGAAALSDSASATGRSMNSTST